jgi:hypothetical protein
VRWIELTGPTALDDDLLAFLNREIALQEETCHVWRESFNELFGEQLSQGLPMHRLQLSTYNEMNRQARNVEEILLAVICAAVTENNPVKIDNLNLLRMRDLFARLDQGYESRTMSVEMLSKMEKASVLKITSIGGDERYRLSLVLTALNGRMEINSFTKKFDRLMRESGYEGGLAYNYTQELSWEMEQTFPLLSRTK